MPPPYRLSIRTAATASAVVLASITLLVGVAPAQPPLANPLIPAETQSGQTQPDQTLRVRVYWGGGKQQAWSGRFTAPGGRLSDLQPLNIGPCVAATLFESKGQIRLREGRRTTHNAFDATLTLGDAKLLRIQLTPDGGEPQTFEIAVERLFADTYSATLNGAAGRLVVHRLQEDQLRVRLGRERRILEPGESLPLTINAAPVGVEPLTPLDLQIEVRQGRAGRVVSSDTRRIEAPLSGPATHSTEIALPSDEGVYSLRIACVRPPGLTTRFLPRSNGRVLVERTFQVVVFDKQRRRKLDSSGVMLAEIDPTAPRWWERVPRWVWPRRLPRPEQQLGSGPLQVVTDAGGGNVVRIPAAEASQAGAWQAYPLPVYGPGVPHVVEVDYPADQPQTLTLSLMDRNVTGRPAALGVGESVAVSDWLVGNDGKTRTARRLFWPRTGAPLLLLSNHQGLPARFGKIRVYRLDGEPSATPLAAGNAADPPTRNRMVALCLTAPRLADAVGASLALAPEGRVAVDDWQTWYETATRLADLVELGGYNGAVLTVASSQGVLYPSGFFPAVPGADSQPLASSTTDLPRKDLLELLLREFDRRGLRLAPAVAFDAALLKPLGACPQQESAGPIYDPLEDATATAMRGVVAELVNRCEQHPSFAGVAVDLGAGGAAGYALLSSEPPPSDQQVNRFLAASELVWPEGVPRNAETTRIALSGPWREPWSKWRTKSLAQLHGSLAKIVRDQAPERRCWLLTHRLGEHPGLRRLTTPTIDRDVDWREELLGVGVAVDGALSPRATILWNRQVVGGREVAIESTGRRLNELLHGVSDWTDRGHGTLLTRHPIERRLAPPTTNDRFSKPLPALLCVSTPADAGAPYVEMLAAGPSAAYAPGDILEGGGSLSLLLDPDAVELRRRLADMPLSDAKPDYQVAARSPLLVRTREEGGRTLLELINPLPWAVETTLTIDTEKATRGGWSDAAPSRLEEGQHAVPRRVPPHGIASAWFESDSLRVTGVRSRVDPAARQALADRLRNLKRRDLSRLSPYKKAQNLSFEQLNERRQIAGWQAIAKGGTIELTDRDPKHGDLALVITNPSGAEASATLQTEPLTAPATGQLALTFHLRPEETAADTRVVVRIEEIGGGYTSSTTLDADRLSETRLRLPAAATAQEEADSKEEQAGWRRPYAFTASDLPINSGKPIRVVFEFLGEGRIAIDDLALYDLVFPLDLGASSSSQKLALLKILREAESALERDDLAECHRLLDGYWPRFLRAYTPLLPEAPPEVIAKRNQPKSKQDATAGDAAARPDADGGGWREYLPRFWR